MNPELIARESEVLSMVADGAHKRRLWAVVLRLRPFRHGNRWCVSTSSPNDPNGISSWGDSPVDAIDAFEHEMYRPIQARQHE